MIDTAPGFRWTRQNAPPKARYLRTSMEGASGVFFLQGSLTFACAVEWSVIDSPLYARVKPNTLGDDDCMTGAPGNKSLGVDTESRDSDRSSVGGVVSAGVTASAGDDDLANLRRAPPCPADSQMLAILLAQLHELPEDGHVERFELAGESTRHIVCTPGAVNCRSPAKMLTVLSLSCPPVASRLLVSRSP